MKCLSCKMEEMEEAKNTYFAQLDNCYVQSTREISMERENKKWTN